MGSAMECLSRGSLVKDNSIIDPKDVGSNTCASNGEGKNCAESIIGIDHVLMRVWCWYGASLPHLKIPQALQCLVR